MQKLFSGRFIWCLASALVFVILACNGFLTSDKVTEIILVIVMAYFGRSDRAYPTEEKK
jgi:amino acid permease